MEVDDITCSLETEQLSEGQVVYTEIKRTVFIRKGVILATREHLWHIEKVPNDGQGTRPWREWKLLVAVDVMCDRKDDEEGGCNDD